MIKTNAFKYRVARDMIAAGTWSIYPDAGVITGRGGRAIGHPNALGYVRLTIADPRRPTETFTVLAHRVIWEYVHGQIPADLTINHMDGDKANNRLANLEAVTVRENVQHAYDTGLNPRILGEHHHRTTFTDAEIREMYLAAWAGGRGIGAELAGRYGTTRQFISSVKHGRRWGHVTTPAELVGR